MWFYFYHILDQSKSGRTASPWRGSNACNVGWIFRRKRRRWRQHKCAGRTEPDGGREAREESPGKDEQRNKNHRFPSAGLQLLRDQGTDLHPGTTACQRTCSSILLGHGLLRAVGGCRTSGWAGLRPAASRGRRRPPGRAGRWRRWRPGTPRPAEEEADVSLEPVPAAAAICPLTHQSDGRPSPCRHRQRARDHELKEGRQVSVSSVAAMEG